MAEQLARRHSRILQVLPPDSPPTMEGHEGVNMEQPASANVHVGTALASETREDFNVYTNTLVQLPSIVDASVHSPLEGHIDIPIQVEFFLNAPFCRTSMGQAIFDFEVIIPSLGNRPLGEEEKRRINTSLERACNFSEEVERIIPSPPPHHETISAHLPRLSDPWLDG